MQKNKSFSLVELLTVIAIVVILLSLLLTSLSLSKQLSRRVKCISNHKQLILTWQMYADDNLERLANNGYIPGGGNENIKMWVQGYLNHASFLKDSFDEELLINPKFAQFGNYIKEKKIYKCPSDNKTFNHDNKTFEKIRSYSMNCYMGWESSIGGGPNPKSVFYKQQDIKDPSNKLVFIDVNPESICWPFFGIETPIWPIEGLRYNDFFQMFPSSLHSRNANIAFSDGHVESHRWKDSRTIKPENVFWHYHRHESKGNIDLVWLRERAK